jgi:AraC-like DNA-binding protein
MEYLYVICIGLLIFFSFSLLTKKNKPLSEKIFSFWIILLLVTVVSFFLYYKGIARQYPLYITLICDSHLLHGALLYLYIRAFTNPSFTLKRLHLWHLTPMIVLILTKLFLNFVLGEMQCYMEGGCVEEDNVFVMMTYLYKYLVLGGYILATWKTGNKYRKNASAPRDIIRSDWVKQICLGVTFLYFGILLIQIGRLVFPYLFWERMLLGNILATLFIFIFLYIGNSYAYLFISPSRKRFVNLSENFVAADCRQQEINNSLEIIFNKLEELMKVRSPYLQPHLTLKELAELIDGNPGLISQAINRHAGCNFNEYVNGYRVEKLKELLSDPSNWNFKIMALAADCGFTSKSTLIRIFRKQTGKTPGEYLHNVKEALGSGTSDAVIAGH